MNTRLYARASAAGAVLCTAAACYAAILNAGWIALGGLPSTVLLAYNARRCHTQARRDRAIEQRLKRLGQEEPATAQLPQPCCTFWLHSDGEVHSPSGCTRPRAARTTLTPGEEREFARLAASLRQPESAPSPAAHPVPHPHAHRRGVTTMPTRTNTPDRHNPDGTTTFKMKRSCNGCGERLGDVTDDEMARALHGLPRTDVRRECPNCGPTAPEPRCLPTRILVGAPKCLNDECDHERGLGSVEEAYCDEVTEQPVCATHTTFNTDGTTTHAEPWPCWHNASAA
ncbi:hypothetical protein PV728_29380 [Streptomyces europaeiscabiei]|uniref:hypothetical protein n=1 Tax=Streptomyces europaeiscabiei TaxID=146819 RepID=UPI0029B0077C|nr:hypothetical protein [Streptomyces europaeiscabiei]MDX3634303.1 hypothetical protein [Streptomyces europaeiscabiei]MDX3651849.1 hypothetical protein [Streptomyces europaeiscabiei]